MRVNPIPFVLVLFTTCLGAVLGSWLIGLTVGVGIVLVAEVLGS